MYETYYNKLQPFFGLENLKLHYMALHCFALSIETQNIIKGLINFEDLFDFINLNENHKLFSNKNKKVVGNFKIETPEFIWID